MGELQLRADARGRSRATWRGLVAVLALAGCTTPAEDVGPGGLPNGIGSAGTSVPVAGGGAGTPGVLGTSGASGSAGVGVGTPTSGTGGMVLPGAGAGGMTAGAGGTVAGAGGVSTGGVGGTGGAGGGGMGGMDGGFMPACMTDPRQAVVVGDSYIDWASHSFPADLAELAGTTGVWNVRPPTGVMYAVGGTSMATGEIPGQLTNALGDNDDVRFVIMDGGGNDVLLNALGQGCKATGSSTMQICKDIVADALAASAGMMDAAAAAGVTNLVYFYYPHVPPDTLLGGPNPNEILDYALPMAKAQCDGTFQRTGSKMKCHFVDMIPVFEGHSDFFALGDLHPNDSGSAAMAAKVWSVMQENCVAQPASSGCCRP